MNLHFVIIHFPEDSLTPQKSDNRTVNSFEFQPNDQNANYLTNTNVTAMITLSINKHHLVINIYFIQQKYILRI